MNDDKFHDECGVTGIFGVENAASLSYFALFALQHRGQESAGIAVSDGTKINLHKQMGLVGDVFDKNHFEKLNGKIAVGHVRYATAGARTIENAQPMVNDFKLGSIALAHNGQLVNYEALREMLEETGATFSSSSDTEVILKLIARSYKKGLENAIINTIKLIKGSYALCLMTENSLIGVRDPNGIRPLVLGKIKIENNNDENSFYKSSDLKNQLEENSNAENQSKKCGYILASETAALDSVNAEFVRDIAPGEIVIITDDGIKSIQFEEKTKKQTCIFEYVYFARPDSVIDGISVQNARYAMGEVLAKESKVDADVVIGVPDSGIGAAMGYAKQSGVPYVTGIIKNKYVGRTFIAPTQAERENMVFVKLNAIKSDVCGKRVIVIDDSIVRGTTSRRLVQILRRAGAKEVHFRVSSPPVKFPCYLGIDTPSKSELISSEHDVNEICKEIGADSLAFISLAGMIEALKQAATKSDCLNKNDCHLGFCEGCFCGEYPVT